jgi:hypothetical protein
MQEKVNLTVQSTPYFDAVDGSGLAPASISSK